MNSIDEYLLVRQSGLFDEKWYLYTYKDVANAQIDPLYHFLRVGGFEGRYPGPKFDLRKYIEQFNKVIQPGLNPLIHFLVSFKMPVDQMDINYLWRKVAQIRYRNHPEELEFYQKIRQILKARSGINVFKAPVCRSRDVKNIVIFKLDHIGDFQISLDAILRIREVFPNSKMHLVCGPWMKKIAEKTELFSTISTIEVFDEKQVSPPLNPLTVDLNSISKILEPIQADIAIDLRYDPETRFLLPLAGAPLTVGYESPYYIPDICIPFDSLPPKMGRTHNSMRLNRLITELPVVNLPVHQPLGEAIGIHAGASHDLKTWPHMKTLVELLIANGYVVHQYGPKGDKLLSEQVFDRIGAVPLESFAETVAEECKIYIGQDTGTTHLVAATGIPVIGIYGGLIDPYGFLPRSPDADVLYFDTECAPCYGKVCKVGDKHCLTKLAPEEVLLFMEHILRRL